MSNIYFSKEVLTLPHREIIRNLGNFIYFCFMRNLVIIVFAYAPAPNGGLGYLQAQKFSHHHLSSSDVYWVRWRYSKCLRWSLWRHQMEMSSALLVLCAGNSPVTGEFPAQRPVTRSFGVFFDLRLNKRLSKHSWGWWYETPSRPLWRHCNDIASLK